MILKRIVRKIFLFIIDLIKYLPFKTFLGIRSMCYKVVLKKMGRCSNICDAVTILDPSKTSIGSYVSIHEYTTIGGMGEVTIGDYVAIGSQCHIVSDTHLFQKRDVLIKKQGVKPEPVVIGNNVWIGTHVVILGGIKIGDGAIIGAGSVVTRDVPENAVAVGVPCGVMRFR